MRTATQNAKHVELFKLHSQKNSCYKAMLESVYIHGKPRRPRQHAKLSSPFALALDALLLNTLIGEYSDPVEHCSPSQRDTSSAHQQTPLAWESSPG